jgi:hypothetical protein
LIALASFSGAHQGGNDAADRRTAKWNDNGFRNYLMPMITERG